MNRKYLVDSLELIKPALAKSDLIPTFQCFMFNEGTISAYNDIIAIVGPTECDENFGVHGNTVLNLLSNSSAEEVTIELDQDVVLNVILKMGKSVSKLPVTPIDDFVFKASGGPWRKIPITISLIEALTLCLETVSVDETQMAFQGITIQDDTMYSCNGDVITRYRLKHSIGKNERVLLPTAFCEAVIKLWSSLELTKGELKFNEEWVSVVFEDWSAYGRVLEIKDPIDFDSLIKRSIKGNVTTITFPIDSLSEALLRAKVLADPESKMTFATVKNGKLELFTETPMGEVRDNVTLKGHPDITANINASYIAKAIKVCDQIAITENCTVLGKAPNVLQVVGNMG